MKEKYAKEKEERDVERVKEVNAEINTTQPIEQKTLEESEAVEVIPMDTTEEIDLKPEEEVDATVKEKSPMDEKQKELSPFEELVRAASLLNPRQFELPIEMTEQFPFPGSERAESMKNGRRVKNKRLIELDTHGCVPLPAKLCFTCNKSCKRAPLISCDYCSLFFHQDCLDPPMCALPSGRWVSLEFIIILCVYIYFVFHQMCPNHSNHFIDWNLVSSLSATERMKLWDQYSKNPIDHEVIKLQFFRKVHMQNPPFRTKLKPKRFDEIEVPEIIRYQYENPPDLLPSMRHVMRIEQLKKRGTVLLNSNIAQVTEIDNQLEALESARKKLKTIFNDQSDIHGILDDTEDEIETENIEKSPSKSPSPKKQKRTKGEPKESESLNADIKAEEKDSNDTAPNQESHNKSLEVDIKIEDEEQTETTGDEKEGILRPTELKAINEQLCNLNSETIKLLAFQRLQQIVNENPNHIQKLQDKSTVSQTVADIAKWDTHRFPIPFPNEVKEEVISDKSLIIRMHDRPFHIRSDEEKASSLALSLQCPIRHSNIKSRAVVTFVNDYLSGRAWFTIAPNLNQSVFMRYRSFDIGIGSDNNLDLSRFGTCAYVSPKHAVIFFDDITKQFELLNYSEFGTEVNGQLFSCDFTERAPDLCESPTSPLKDKRVAIQSKIKNMIDAKKKIREAIDKPGTENEAT